MIGTKTLAILTFTLGVVIAVVALGSFAPERLMTRGFGTMLLVGVFGAVVGTLVFRFWRLGEKSHQYFRYATEKATWDATEVHFVGGEHWRIVIGENREGEAFDLPPPARLAATLAAASLVALAAIDSRALGQLKSAYDGAGTMTAQYCPPEEDAKPAEADPNVPGCELVRRAYALGYAKTLGDCAPKAEQQAKTAKPVCTRRQRDEPALHYSWRLLATWWTGFRSSTRVGYFQRAREDFRKRAEHLKSLRLSETEMLTSAPHASHHIWTNLVDPKDGAFDGTTCTAKYAHLPHRPTPPAGPTQASLVLEHVIGQLLFEGTYDNSAGHCRETHVHWGAPPDACARLAANPEAFLKPEAALDDVRTTLERYRVAKDLVALGGPKPAEDPASFVSFHCYVEGDAADRKSTPFTLEGARFSADEIHVPPSAPNAALYIDRYDAVARLLVNGFHYGILASEAGIDQTSAAGLEASFTGNDYLVTRLYELESVDIYLDPSWMATRSDLLEVYPYDLHLKNYIQVFRRQYRRRWGRL